MRRRKRCKQHDSSAQATSRGISMALSRMKNGGEGESSVSKVMKRQRAVAGARHRNGGGIMAAWRGKIKRAALTGVTAAKAAKKGVSSENHQWAATAL